MAGRIIVPDADTPEDFVVLLELNQRKYTHGNVGEESVW